MRKTMPDTKCSAIQLIPAPGRMPVCLVAALPGLILLLLCSSSLPGQTIYDLGEINGDLRILGDQRNDDVGTPDTVSIFDFNGNGMNDLFLLQGYDGSVYGFFDVDFDHPNSFIDLRSSQPDLYIPYNISAYFAFDRLFSLDLNGDGIDDLVASSKNSYSGGTSSRIYVIYGSSGWITPITINLAIESADLTIFYGNSDDVNFGSTLAEGDVNADGIADLIIGAEDAENPEGLYKGAAYVIFGSTSFTPHGTINLGKQPADLTFFGGGGNDNFGSDVASGDVNGDGIDDMLVSAVRANFDQIGRIYVFFGSDNFPPGHSVDLTYESADITIISPHVEARFGRSVTSGDINGDGIDDICGGGPWVEAPDGIAKGAAFLIYGRNDFPPTATIQLDQEPADITAYGNLGDYSNFGYNMRTGDMDGDGCDEWAISAWKSEQRPDLRGEVFIIQGSANYPPEHVIDFESVEPSISVWGNDEEDYLILCGKMVDADRDGRSDLILGAQAADRPDAESCGETYVILSRGPLNDPPRYLASPGPAPGNSTELRLFDPYDPASWILSFFPYQFSGYGLNVAAGDLDGDGYDELITGPGPGPAHQPIVAGFTHDGDHLFEYLAYGAPKYGVIVTSGDLDGDGVDEIITGAGPGAVYGPHVRGWSWDGVETVSPLPGVSFLAYGTHRWGVNVTCGDIDGDGNDEIITGAGPGDVFGPHVRGWNVDGGLASSIPEVSYFAYGTLRWGVNVACGDIDGDGIDEIVTGPGPSELFSSHVRGWNFDGEVVEPIPGVNFIAYSGFPSNMGCVVACGDADNDRVAEILTAPGPHPDNPAYLKTWNYDGDALTLMQRKSFLVFEEGGYVAGARIALGNLYQQPGYLP